MIYYVIPARRNSVGVPFKNRTLLEHTIGKISKGSNIVVSTDDEFIVDKVKDIATVINRSPELSEGDISIKRVMEDVVCQLSLKDEDVVVMLYLVYPTRTQDDIKKAVEFYEENGGKSLLCGYNTGINPFVSFYAKPNHRGELIVENSYHRRQDYPEYFYMSHFISIFNVGELRSLNGELYNEHTLFYRIEKPVNVDTVEDLTQFRSVQNGK
jgi:CMP-N-acetylneuraminic acid synthetase